MPKIFLGESFSVSFISAIKKVWKGGKREYRDFASKFLSHCNEIFHWRTLWSFRRVLLSKIFLGESFSVSFIPAIKKNWKGWGREYRDFASKFLSHCNEIFHWRTLWCFRKIFYWKTSWIGGGGIFVLSKVFVSQDRNEKIYKGTLQFSGRFLVSKKVYGEEGAYHDFL